MTSGDTAFSKRDNTELRAEPRPDAEVTGKISFAQKVSIKEVQGRWFQVSGGGQSGWIYSGDVMDREPPKENKADILPTSAGSATAATASRGIGEETRKYASSRGHGTAANDVQWLEDYTAKISADDVEQYCKENKKGRYAP